MNLDLEKSKIRFVYKIYSDIKLTSILKIGFKFHIEED